MHFYKIFYVFKKILIIIKFYSKKNFDKKYKNKKKFFVENEQKSEKV